MLKFRPAHGLWLGAAASLVPMSAQGHGPPPAPELQAVVLPSGLPDRMELEVQLGDAPVMLRLDRVSMRDERFQVRVAGRAGVGVAGAPPPRTYRGVVAGRAGSAVAASLDEDGLRAVIRVADGEVWSVAPVKNGPAGAVAPLHEAARDPGLPGAAWSCGVSARLSWLGEPQQDPDTRGPERGSLLSTQIAFDADVEYFLLNNASVADTVTDIELVMNGVETIYAGQAGISFLITDILVRTEERDPYSTSSAGALLDQFGNHWNANEGAIVRDVAHLFTGRELDGSIIGVAWLGVVCVDPPFAYGLSQSRFTEFLPWRIGLTAHELGHNFGANHCDAAADCGIMCSAIASCAAPVDEFGATSLAEISAFLAFADCFDPSCAVELTLTADPPADHDFLGRSLAADGRIAAAGAPFVDAGDTNNGAATVWRFTGLAWTPEAQLTASDGETNDEFGISIAASANAAGPGADAVIVGAWKEDHTSLLNAGAAYVFRRMGQKWVQEAKLTASDDAAGDQFGVAVAIRGQVAAVGANFDNSQRGAVYVFRHTGDGDWGQIQKITAPDSKAGQRFGEAVSLSLRGTEGLNLLIGAPRDDELGTNAGAAYIYEYVAGTFIYRQKLLAFDGHAGDMYGEAVTVDPPVEGGSGGIAVIGAKWTDDAGTSSGAVYIYRDIGGLWIDEVKVTAPDAEAGDFFGQSTALRSGMLLVGAYADDDGGLDAGAAYVYAFDGAVWHFDRKITMPAAAAGDALGISAALSEEFALIGAYGDDLSGGKVEYLNSGSIYAVAGITGDCNGNGVNDFCDVYEGLSPDVNQNGVPDECEPPPKPDCPADCGNIPGDGLVNVGDLLALLAQWGVGGSCDQNDDGLVNVGDLLALLAAWGKCL
jgi:hypothetical protein